MSPDDPDDFFRPPNDNAYKTDEVRTGPPLNYVAEKVRHNLEALHSLIHDIRQRVVTLERRGLIERVPGQARSIRLLLAHKDLPDLE